MTGAAVATDGFELDQLVSLVDRHNIGFAPRWVGEVVKKHIDHPAERRAFAEAFFNNESKRQSPDARGHALRLALREHPGITRDLLERVSRATTWSLRESCHQIAPARLQGISTPAAFNAVVRHVVFDLAGLTGGKLLTKVDIPRSQVFALLNERRERLPGRRQQLIDILSACKLDPRQIDELLAVWQNLRATRRTKTVAVPPDVEHVPPAEAGNTTTAPVQVTGPGAESSNDSAGSAGVVAEPTTRQVISQVPHPHRQHKLLDHPVRELVTYFRRWPQLPLLAGMLGCITWWLIMFTGPASPLALHATAALGALGFGLGLRFSLHRALNTSAQHQHADEQKKTTASTELEALRRRLERFDFYPGGSTSSGGSAQTG